MTNLELRETAVGPCIVCRGDSDGSFYWLGMSDEAWATIKPYVAHLFKPDMVQKTLFVAGLDRPFCGAICSNRYHREHTYVDGLHPESKPVRQS